MRYIINTAIILNAIFASIIGLMLIFITNNPEYQIINFATTLSLSMIFTSVAVILGNLFILPLTKGHKISYYILASFIGLVIIFIILVLMYFGFSFGDFTFWNLNSASNNAENLAENHAGNFVLTGKNLVTLLFILIDALASLLATIASVKSHANLLRELNQNTLATGLSILSTIVTLAMPVGTFVILFIANNYNLAYASYFAIATLLIGIFLVFRQKFSI